MIKMIRDREEEERETVDATKPSHHRHHLARLSQKLVEHVEAGGLPHTAQMPVVSVFGAPKASASASVRRRTDASLLFGSKAAGKPKSFGPSAATFGRRATNRGATSVIEAHASDAGALSTRAQAAERCARERRAESAEHLVSILAFRKVESSIGSL